MVAPASVVGFADESGTHPGAPCFGIGCLVLPQDAVSGAIVETAAAIERSGMPGELKWEKVRGDSRVTAAAIDVVSQLLAGDASYHAIVVKKDIFERWKEDKEAGFYLAYHELAKNLCRQITGSLTLLIDERADRYQKRDDVLEIVTNYAVARAGDSGRIADVRKVDSAVMPLITGSRYPYRGYYVGYC